MRESKAIKFPTIERLHETKLNEIKQKTPKKPRENREKKKQSISIVENEAEKNNNKNLLLKSNEHKINRTEILQENVFKTSDKVSFSKEKVNSLAYMNMSENFLFKFLILM